MKKVLLGILLIPLLLGLSVLGATNSTLEQLNSTVTALANHTADYPAVAVPSWLDTGSNAWMLTAATFVGLQSVPGVALYYAGLSKKKYSINSAMMVFYAFAAVLVVWMIAGYNFGFGKPLLEINGFGILGSPTPATSGLYEGSQTIYGPANTPLDIPTSTYIFFQFVFAAITPVLLAGGVLERMNFKAWMVFVPLWSLLVYSPVAYWLFAGGWLNQLGAVDFSGGYVIHVDAGVGALAAALAVGPRVASERKLEAHSLPLILAGAGLIWLGWDGFNGGDPGGSTIDAAIAVLNTNIATAVSAITWMLMDMKFFGKPSLIGATSGAITGLVAITPAAGYVNGSYSMLIGIASGSLPWLALYKLEPRLKVDDSLGVFSTHGIAGIVGGILTGVFADPNVTKYVDPALVGALYGNVAQVGIQALGALVVFVYDFAVTYGLLKAIGLFIPLRAPPEELKVGDYAMHGERAYAEVVATEGKGEEVKEEVKDKEEKKE
ncbi:MULTISPECIES: ammonium transporter [Metallosphaera]|uniref:Ammonium transporter n=1 Tax=Metallosphaera prunae TaxID=47304 RepID=A0A4D8RWS7_METPR|nr:MULTISPECIES: ammonium transporter [Metallosphaera]MCH1771997.1 ammonium transporter [Metallosphaera sedula]MCP6728480.1 ammonium transporter [Metallosphaera sedula]QCO29457.1 ammonium transporter [Metallosphaera prunae]BBL46891.1 ammonium transporter [Metallosphaera sedula]